MRNRIILYFVLVLAVGGAVWGVLRIVQNQDAAAAQFKREAKTAKQGTAIAHKATEAARADVARVDTLYLPGRIRWRALADSTIAHEKTNPQAANVAHHADTVLVGDSVVIAARDKLIAKQDAELDSTKKELKVWQHKPGAPRLQLYGEGDWDLINQVPVVRAGLDVHVWRALSLTSLGEYALKSPTMPGGFRVTAGVRFTF
jgi:hypothetical protein